MRCLLPSEKPNAPHPVFQRMLGLVLFVVFTLGEIGFWQSSASGFDVIAHRGGRFAEPENTLDAFAHALSLGVSGLDADIVITKDSVPVLHHGVRLHPDIARGPDGRWVSGTPPLIRRLSYREMLRDYDVGSLAPESRLGRSFPEQTRTDGAHIPSLAELLTLVKRSRNKSVQLFLETRLHPKERHLTATPRSFAALLARTIRGYRMLDRTTIMSLDWITLGPVRDLAPEVRRGCMTSEQRWLDTIQRNQPQGSPWLAGRNINDYEGSVPDMVADFGCQTWLPFWGDVTPEALKRAKTLRLSVIPWVVDDPIDVTKAIQMGLDGILTDHPAQVRQIMLEQGLLLPPRTAIKP